MCIMCDDSDGDDCSCGCNRAAVGDDSAIRSPSPTGPLHRAFRKHVFRPRGTTKPVFGKLLRGALLSLSVLKLGRARSARPQRSAGDQTIKKETGMCVTRRNPQ